MTISGLIGAAAALSSLLAGPAMAQGEAVHAGHRALSTYCATIEPGNPYSKAYDFMSWSAWRRHGSWDSRGDDACARNPSATGGNTF